jgi:Acyl-protein synthetase, LuxE
VTALESCLSARPYSLGLAEKNSLLCAGLNELTAHHYNSCAPYARILEGYWGGLRLATDIADLPYLPVSLFKTQRLLSVAEEDIRVTLTSSGTTGQAVSQILVDRESSALQQRALAYSLMHVLGPKRLPMLVIDTDAVFKDPKMMSARGAGVLGQMRFGHAHTFALDRDLKPDFDAVRTFLKEHGNAPFFMFGFTFMVWINFYEQFREEGLDLSNGVLIHSGGWKKMVERSVDNAAFRSALRESFGLTRVHNFYGMVEQIGSIFLEGPGGLLYPPNFSDVIIRDPLTWQVAPIGQPGVVQVVSLLPRSYPGHSLLTEDLGVIEAIDPGEEGWMGKGLKILGRVAKAELRGCSDIIAAEAA